MVSHSAAVLDSLGSLAVRQTAAPGNVPEIAHLFFILTS